MFYAVSYEKFADSGIRPFFFEIVCSEHKEDTFFFQLALFQHLSCLYSMKQGRRKGLWGGGRKLRIPQKFENFGDFED